MDPLGAGYIFKHSEAGRERERERNVEARDGEVRTVRRVCACAPSIGRSHQVLLLTGTQRARR